jgi:hypothetical protein
LGIKSGNDLPHPLVFRGKLRGIKPEGLRPSKTTMTEKESLIKHEGVSLQQGIFSDKGEVWKVDFGKIQKTFFDKARFLSKISLRGF